MSNTAISTNNDYIAVLQKRLSDKIKASFIELIPEEQFDAMVNNAMDEIMNGPKKARFVMKSIYEGNRYVDKLVPIEGYNVLLDKETVPGMIYAELHDQAKQAVLKVMARPEYSNAFDNPEMQDKIEKGIAQVVTENPDVFMKSLISGIIRSAMNTTLNELRNNNQRIGIY